MAGSHEWPVKFIEHRVGDSRVVRLIQKWLTVGILDGGIRVESEEGTPQGAFISPLLANIYLHYVYDLWAHQWRQRHATGDVFFVRYANETGYARRDLCGGRSEMTVPTAIEGRRAKSPAYCCVAIKIETGVSARLD